MMYARKYTKRYYKLLLVVGTSLIISTVYLRYHYVIDVIAGIILAVAIYYIAPYLYQRIKSWKNIKFTIL